MTQNETRRAESETIGDDEMSKDLKNYLAKHVTTREAAEMLGVGQKHISLLIERGKLQATKVGYSWLVFAPSLEKYLANKSKRGRPSSGTPTLRQVEKKTDGQGE